MQKGEKQVIYAKIESLEVKSQTNNRIEADVKILYKDQRLKESGEVVSETNIPTLKVKYILGRKKQQWKLVNFSSQS